MSHERQVQYEFKVIVRSKKDTWPHEISDAIEWLLRQHTEAHAYPAFSEVVSVERIDRDW